MMSVEREEKLRKEKSNKGRDKYELKVFFW